MKRDSKSDQNRERIVSVALRLFSERGYGATSIGDIAEESGLLKGNLAYYFKTKSMILEAVVEARQADFLGRLTTGLAAEASPLDALEHFLRVVEADAPALIKAGCPIGTLCSELGKTDSALHPLAVKLLLAVQTALTEQFTRVLPAKEAQGAAEHLLAMMQGATLLAQAYRNSEIIFRQANVARQWLRTVLLQPENTLKP